MILKNLNLKLKNIKEKLQNFVDYLKIKVVLNHINFKKNNPVLHSSGLFVFK